MGAERRPTPTLFKSMPVGQKIDFVKAPDGTPIQDPRRCKTNIKAAKTYATAIRAVKIDGFVEQQGLINGVGADLCTLLRVDLGCTSYDLTALTEHAFLILLNEIPGLSIRASCQDCFSFTQK